MAKLKLQFGGTTLSEMYRKIVKFTHCCIENKKRELVYIQV